MKNLYLLRHAKSSWVDARLADFDRPLNDRGRAAAAFVGGHLAEWGLLPDTIISSTAVRARSTADLVCDAAHFGDRIVYESGIYEAGTGQLAEIISAIDIGFKSAMIIGHNPGIEGLIYHLTGGLEPMPTAALAAIELDIQDWAQMTDGCGHLIRVIRPKELMGR
ncbi:MAG TPA: histidine phosphatase family protein [Pyrinomonadaceae bacterium]|jgi:phosphohistidine phosphatase|nr:histidine phosphatase family protein [Chloracidobacterium sp.]MBP9935568.1 histidine phosphatase family protein [Pyrinomonadaceae bacterium]MBK7801147.1 histidine phosphatase family protein [Chloracidobacterium sp.]MBK9436470.1 histidine phosphatase family protein [Chloracidobacterium sp.]MBL0241452.1 histidine phosphatase family protein [Chloracidobacterium sp.]